MILKIDASNILAGGGKTHLVELIQNAEPKNYGFDKVILYGHESVLHLISDYEWLTKKSPRLFRFGYAGRFVWQIIGRRRVKNGIWFVPGAGSAPGNYVTMCQNLLPIDEEERNRYFFSFTWLRLVILSLLNLRDFQNASGVIFLNNYCFERLPGSVKDKVKCKAIIPHGVNEIFKPSIVNGRNQNELKLIYVSIIDVYKHQWNIALAIKELVAENYSVNIDFVGPANPRAFKKLKPLLDDNIRYHSAIHYSDLPAWYSNADAFIFGSTCETFGMVLSEAMACGLPVLCSNKSSMHETLGNHAIYFDPLNINDIKRVIRQAYHDRPLLSELGAKGNEYIRSFTWQSSADKTFRFIAECSKSINK